MTNLKNRDGSLHDLFGNERPIDKLRSRNPVFNSSYKTCSNMGTKLPDSIKRLQVDYIKNNGGDINDLSGNYQTDRHFNLKMVSILFTICWDRSILFLIHFSFHLGLKKQLLITQSQ